MAKRYIGGKSPGEQKPEKYGGRVGPAYQQWGEQTGLLYYPPTDTYYEDPKYKADYYEQNGLAPDGSIVQPEPEKPSMLDTIGPYVATGGAIGMGQALMNPGFWSTVAGGSGTAAGTAGASGAGAAAGAATGAVPSAPVMLPAGTTVPTTVTQGGGSLFGSGASTGGGMLDSIGSAGVAEGGLGLGMGPISVPGVAAGAATGYLQGQGLWDAAKGKDMSGLSQAALALPTFGASLLYNPIKDALGFGDQDKWQTEGNRLKDLAGQGVYVPDNLIAGMPTGGRGKDELVNQNYGADFVGRDDQGNWVNNLFANDRDVKNLRPEDIVNYGTWAENDPEWFKKPLDQRLTIAGQALQSGAVNEHHGTIDVDFEKLPPGGTTAAAPAPAATSGGVPPRGTRLSPGIYADGKGGSYRG